MVAGLAQARIRRRSRVGGVDRARAPSGRDRPGDPAGSRPTGDLRAATAGPARAAVHSLQVSHDERRARGRRPAPAGSRAIDPSGAAPPPDEPRRAAGARQRDSGRDEPGRPPAAVDGVSAALYPGAGPPPRRAPRDHRLGSAQRPQRAAVGAALRARRLVRGAPVATPRRLDLAADDVEGCRAGRRQPARGGARGAFPRARDGDGRARVGPARVANARVEHGGCPPMELMPIIRPTLPEFREFEELVRPSWEEGQVTTGRIGRAFEEEVCRLTGAREAVAMSSCTAGLMLAAQALELPAGAEVIVPSFTFAATAQALVWNGLVPVFCDCRPDTLTLEPADVERNLTSRTAAICAAYVYGLPPDIDALTKVGERHGIPLYFDSAQGLGAEYQGRQAGAFGQCEIFSLSPTKVVT